MGRRGVPFKDTPGVYSANNSSGGSGGSSYSSMGVGGRSGGYWQQSAHAPGESGECTKKLLYERGRQVLMRWGFVLDEMEVSATTFGIEKVRTVGGEYIACAGLPTHPSTSARKSILSALKFACDVECICRYFRVPVRIGIASGVVVAGSSRTDMLSYELLGDALTNARRITQRRITQRRITQERDWAPSESIIVDSMCMQWIEKSQHDVQFVGNLQFLRFYSHALGEVVCTILNAKQLSWWMKSRFDKMEEARMEGNEFPYSKLQKQSGSGHNLDRKSGACRAADLLSRRKEIRERTIEDMRPPKVDKSIADIFADHDYSRWAFDVGRNMFVDPDCDMRLVKYRKDKVYKGVTVANELLRAVMIVSTVGKLISVYADSDVGFLAFRVLMLAMALMIRHQAVFLSNPPMAVKLFRPAIFIFNLLIIDLRHESFALVLLIVGSLASGPLTMRTVEVQENTRDTFVGLFGAGILYMANTWNNPEGAPLLTWRILISIFTTLAGGCIISIISKMIIIRESFSVLLFVYDVLSLPWLSRKLKNAEFVTDLIVQSTMPRNWRFANKQDPASQIYAGNFAVVSIELSSLKTAINMMDPQQVWSVISELTKMVAHEAFLCSGVLVRIFGIHCLVVFTDAPVGDGEDVAKFHQNSLHHELLDGTDQVSDYMYFKKNLLLNCSERALQFTHMLFSRVAKLNERKNIGFSIQAGLDRGPVFAGVIGGRKHGFDVFGRTVSNAVHMSSIANHGVVISKSIRKDFEATQRVNLRANSVSPDAVEDEVILTRAYQLKLFQDNARLISLNQYFDHTIKSYDVIKMLGRGSYGSVHLTQHKKTRDYFAIKVIKKKFAGHISHWMLSEFRILCEAVHPNVVKLFHCLESKSKIFFVLEFIQGGTLNETIRSYKPPNLALQYWFQELVLAIDHVHRLGILHRDIKPENCMVGMNGHLKLMDFGLSKIVKQVPETYRNQQDESLPNSVPGKAWEIMRKLVPHNLDAESNPDARPPPGPRGPGTAVAEAAAAAARGRGLGRGPVGAVAKAATETAAVREATASDAAAAAAAVYAPAAVAEDGMDGDGMDGAAEGGGGSNGGGDGNYDADGGGGFGHEGKYESEGEDGGEHGGGGNDGGVVAPATPPMERSGLPDDVFLKHDFNSEINLLMVEDDETVLHLAVYLFKQKGWKCRSAHTGDEALVVLKNYKSMINIILLDIGLPGKNGFEVLNAIKRKPAYADIPVVMVTSADSLKCIENAFVLGAKNYIIKPLKESDCDMIYRVASEYIYKTKFFKKQSLLRDDVLLEAEEEPSANSTDDGDAGLVPHVSSLTNQRPLMYHTRLGISGASVSSSPKPRQVVLKEHHPGHAMRVEPLGGSSLGSMLGVDSSSEVTTKRTRQRHRGALSVSTATSSGTARPEPVEVPTFATETRVMELQTRLPQQVDADDEHSEDSSGSWDSSKSRLGPISTLGSGALVKIEAQASYDDDKEAQVLLRPSRPASQAPDIESRMKYSMVGTPYYMAPEMVRHERYGVGVDWWSFGVLVYECSTGRLPFSGDTAKQVFEKIVHGTFETRVISDEPDLLSLVVGLLCTRKKQRLGANGAGAIMEHPYFTKGPFPWDTLRTTPPPFLPPGGPSLESTPEERKHAMKMFRSGNSTEAGSNKEENNASKEKTRRRTRQQGDGTPPSRGDDRRHRRDRRGAKERSPRGLDDRERKDKQPVTEESSGPTPMRPPAAKKDDEARPAAAAVESKGSPRGAPQQDRR